MLALKDIEDALIVDVKANIDGVKTCETHEKEFDKALLSALLPRSPFVLVRYGGTRPDEAERHADGSSGMNGREFYLSVGASSLRTKKEAQRGIYDILDDLKNEFDGMTMTVSGGEVTFHYNGDRLLFSEEDLVVYAMVIGWEEN